MELEENKELEELKQLYNNPNFITTTAIFLLSLIILLSQAFAVKNNLSTNDILRNLLNHNIIYLIGLIYFIPLKTKSGKKYFNYFNLFLIIIYSIFTLTSLLTIIQSFGITSLVNFSINITFLVYMIHVLLKNTRIWKEFKLASSPFNEITNDNYFYAIFSLTILSLIINLIDAKTVDGAILSIVTNLYLLVLGRYIYLYQVHIDNRKIKVKSKKVKKSE